MKLSASTAPSECLQSSERDRARPSEIERDRRESRERAGTQGNRLPNWSYKSYRSYKSYTTRCIARHSREMLSVNTPLPTPSKSLGMKTPFFVSVAAATAGLLIAGCGEQSAPTSKPEASATPATTPATAPTATPQTAPTAPPAPSATPAQPNASPATSPSPATSSDARPQFSSPSVNEYVQTYDAYISDFKTAYAAMKQGDMSKYQAVIQRAQELETKGNNLQGELPPDEQQRFAEYLNKRANELAQFAQGK